MTRTRLALAALFAATLCSDSSPANGKDGLLAQVRDLEKRIEKVRGLKFKQPVVAHVIARTRAHPPGVQGYYDTKKKALFLFDDVKGNYQKGVLIHEMVHALQDQHFGLSKLHLPDYGSDAALARAALIEGDATYTMIEVLKDEQPHVKKMLGTSLGKAKHLQNAFLYGAGARYVQALKQKGGWKAVDARYRFPPTSTAVILHPDERITPINLGPGRTVGEFGIIRLLQGNDATAAVSVEAAAGWRGDRRVEDGKSFSRWVVAFAAPEQARRFHSALAAKMAQGPGRQVVSDAAGARVWKEENGSWRGVLLRGNRVFELSAKDEATYRALVEGIDGPPKVSVYSAREKRDLTFGEFTDRLLEADLVCVGETHDSEAHHQVQLMVIKALFARDERLGVGMEMFQRPFQKVLDRYVSGAISEEVFLDDSEYRQRWGYDWGLYRPIVAFCRHNAIPLAALNLPNELRQRLSAVGHDKLTAEEKKQLGDVDFHVKEHRTHWFDKLGAMHGHGPAMSKEAREKFYQVMTAWDEYMADSAARFQKERKLRRLVVLAGSGHIDRGFGIPQRAAKRTGGKAVTVRIVFADEAAAARQDPAADFVVVTRPFGP